MQVVPVIWLTVSAVVTLPLKIHGQGITDHVEYLDTGLNIKSTKRYLVESYVTTYTGADASSSQTVIMQVGSCSFLHSTRVPYYSWWGTKKPKGMGECHYVPEIDDESKKKVPGLKESDEWHWCTEPGAFSYQNQLKKKNFDWWFTALNDRCNAKGGRPEAFTHPVPSDG